MDKNAIQKYAVWARRELLERVTQKAYQYGVREDGIDDVTDSIDGRLLSRTELDQRRDLVSQVRDKGFTQVMEEVAYTWFNRFCALRFMEVNQYLPVRVFSDAENQFKPQIITEALQLEMKSLDMAKVYEYVENNQKEALFKLLLIAQCNELNKPLPCMFQSIDNYTELLFPDNLLREGSVAEQLVSVIPHDDWKDAVQIIGWLYQYYNTDPKSVVDKQTSKITKEQIPAATQLFTPDWIVRYMVENSLGRIAVDKLGLDPVAMGWKYYLPEAEQTPEVAAQLKVLSDSENFQLEELRIIDPCMGSGHILVYTYDVLMQIYQSQSYTPRNAVASVLENNLFGLDIDLRAYQMAYFAVMMKARSFDRRFLDRGIAPQLFCPTGYPDGEEYGSLLTVDELEPMPEEPEELTLFNQNHDVQMNRWNFRRLLAQKYDVVITNPPYKKSGVLNSKLKEFIEKNFADSKADLFSAFMEQCVKLTTKMGYTSMITMHSWMFLSTYEKLRAKMMQYNLINMAHLGANAFEEIKGEVVQTTAFVFKKINIQGYLGRYERLTAMDSQDSKENAFLAKQHTYHANQEGFKKIPDNAMAYWLSEKIIAAFSNQALSEFLQTREGMATAGNDVFLRNWSEVNFCKMDFNAINSVSALENGKKWFPYLKGGESRKWYGNHFLVVNWENDGFSIKNNIDRTSGRVRSHNYNGEFSFAEGLSWTAICSGEIPVRYSPTGFLFDSKGAKGFIRKQFNIFYLIAFLNSKVSNIYLEFFSPSYEYKVGHISKIPLVYANSEDITMLTKQNIALSRTDWDSFETSWDFQRHPLAPSTMAKKEQMDSQFATSRMEKFGQLAWQFDRWNEECTNRFNQLKANEEELNRIFVDIYGLQDELTPEVEDKDVTVRKAELTREIKSLISYAVGCMLGRYSLDVDGLAYAGGNWDTSKYTTFTPDEDNVIPICDDAYFDDDMAGRFEEFVATVYGRETLKENLQFVADALGGKGDARDIIRNYFLNDFFDDHCNTYQVRGNGKRPIYWLFSSGKNNGFKALIYMHRYNMDTLARIRTDYVYEQQERYRTAIAQTEHALISAEGSNRVALNKQLTKLRTQLEEASVYEEKIGHLADQRISIDLDDGVKHNYPLFQEVLAKIK